MSNLFNEQEISSDTVISVSQITKKIKSLLEPNLKNIWIKGEISNLRIQQSGHCYFSLKDNESQIPCVFFNRYYIGCNFALKEGLEINVLGDIVVYEPYGRYQISIKFAQESGKGNLYLIFEKLKEKLKQEGMFDAINKIELPSLPKRIALITSPTGAAIKDFIKTLKRKDYKGVIDLFPVKVQGKDAHLDIINAINHISTNNSKYDLLVLTRGGGSIEDLWTFNEENLARALYNCKVASLSAIGHEIDIVLTDLVADKRAETPTGAAEIIASNFLNNVDALNILNKSFNLALKNNIKSLNDHINNNVNKLALLSPQNQIDKLSIKIDFYEKKLVGNISNTIKKKNIPLNSLVNKYFKCHPENYLKYKNTKLELCIKEMNQLKFNFIKNKFNELKNLESRINNNDIKSTLKRGYVILKNESNKILSRLEDAKKESNINAYMYDGEISLKTKK